MKIINADWQPGQRFMVYGGTEWADRVVILERVAEAMAKALDEGMNHGGIYRDKPDWWGRAKNALAAYVALKPLRED